MSYQKDTQYNLYFRPEAAAFGYSEGAEAEQRLLDIVESLDDRSTFSPEYLDNIVDWSTRYHFSRARHCLLRPLDIGPNDRVLELGCGTGAITRYLGETGAQVTAVEGSLARARVAAARCADLPNVTVIADDLQAAEVEGQYDWVTFIGVLEYAAAYSDAEDPYQSYLQAAMRYLKPGGKLVVAIENQLGIKYFNACGEDHLGKPFMGIQDLYQPTGGPRTFGRRALQQVLERAGLPQQQWLYPYPDYKVPSVVLSDAALAHPGFQAHDLLLRSDSEDYSDNRQRIFDEALVNRVLHQNGLLGDFSNSFLVVAQRDEVPAASQQASKGQTGEKQTSEKRASKKQPGDRKAAEAPAGDARAADALWKPAAIAWTFAAVHRHRGMATETRFIPQDDGRIRVTKQRILPEEPSTLPLIDDHHISLNAQDSDYFPGQQMAWAALTAHVRTGDVASLVEALRPWCETLLFAAEVGASPLLPVEEAGARTPAIATGVPNGTPAGDAAVDGAAPGPESGQKNGQESSQESSQKNGAESAQGNAQESAQAHGPADTPAGAPCMPGMLSSEAASTGTRGRPLRLLSLPGGMMDMVPFNMLVNGQNGRHQVIDQEWEVSCPVPAGWVLTRGVMHTLQTGLVAHDSLGSIARVVIALADRCGYYATPEDVERWLALEEVFLRAVSVRAVNVALYTGTRRPVPMVLDTIASQAAALHDAQQQTARAEETIENLRQQLAAREQELIDNLKRIDDGHQREKALQAQVRTLLDSRSWRWSSWLRTLRRRSRI